MADFDISRTVSRIDASLLSEIQRSALVSFHGYYENDYVESFLQKTKKLWEKVRCDE